MRFLFVLIFAFSSFSVWSNETESQNELVQKLLDQNKELVKIIDKNNNLIKDTLVSTSTSKIPNESRFGKEKTFMVGLSYTRLGVDYYYDSTDFSMPGATVSYRPWGKFWLEGSYSRTIIDSYPNYDIDTSIETFVSRIKYDIDINFLGIHLQPYLGYQMISGNSPDAGVDLYGERTQSELNEELDLLDNIYRDRFVFGASILKPLFSYGFARADLGSDMYSFSLGAYF